MKNRTDAHHFIGIHPAIITSSTSDLTNYSYTLNKDNWQVNDLLLAVKKDVVTWQNARKVSLEFTYVIMDINTFVLILKCKFLYIDFF